MNMIANGVGIAWAYGFQKGDHPTVVVCAGLATNGVAFILLLIVTAQKISKWDGRQHKDIESP